MADLTRSKAGKFDKTDLTKTARDTVLALIAVVFTDPSVITHVDLKRSLIVIAVAILQAIQRLIKDNTK